jgi:hypothetical protein
MSEFGIRYRFTLCRPDCADKVYVLLLPSGHCPHEKATELVRLNMCYFLSNIERLDLEPAEPPKGWFRRLRDWMSGE